MSFKVWANIFSNPKLVEVCKDIQENILDDWFNFEDTSVGIYWVCEIDGEVIGHLESDCDILILKWNKDYLHLEIEGKYEVYIKRYEDKHGSEWIIDHAREYTNYEKEMRSFRDGE
jgi:hypothetical protein